MIKLTDRQLQVLDAVRKGHQEISVVAYAGSGKTTTLKYVADVLNEQGENGLYIAFNRDIVNEALKKMPENIKSSTAHSLAYRAVGVHYKHRLNTRLTGKRLAGDYLKLTCGVDPGKPLIPLTVAQTGYLVLDTIRRFCYSNDPEMKLRHVPSLKGADQDAARSVKEQILPLAKKTWEMMADRKHSIPVTHDVYLKLWALSNPDPGYDTILLDEAQDTNPVLLGVLKGHTQRGGRLILVGDPYQKIYGWRMAENVMAKFPDAEQINLVHTFRFGPTIAKYANLALFACGAKEPLVGCGNPDGSVTLGGNEATDAILFRGNSAMFSEAISLIEQGKRIKIPLSNINEMNATIRDMIALREGRRPSGLDLAAFETWSDLTDYVENASDAGELRTLVKLFEKHGGYVLQNILEKLKYVQDDYDVVLSTGHKAKGLEWDSVKVFDDMKPSLPGRTDKNGDPIPVSEEENNLYYVAITRGRKKVVMPDNKETQELLNNDIARKFAALAGSDEDDKDDETEVEELELDFGMR